MTLPDNTIFIFLLFVSAIFVKNSAQTLSIGAILDTNSRVGREQKIAIEVAIRRFNSSSQVIILKAINLRSNYPRQAALYGISLSLYGNFLSHLVEHLHNSFASYIFLTEPCEFFFFL